MSKTVYHEASLQWLPTAYAKQIDDALAAAREVGRNGYPTSGDVDFSKQYIETAPVILAEEAGPDNVNRLVALVERMLDLNKKKAAEKNPDILDQRETQISATARSSASSTSSTT